MKKLTKKMIILIFFIALICFLWWIFKVAKHYPKKIDLQVPNNYFGITFSTKFAKELKLSWQSTYLNILNDLEVKNIRLPIYWDEVEEKPKSYNYEVYDYLINEGSKRDVNFVISVGYRLPRWPECHLPSWAKEVDEKTKEERLLAYIKKTIERYKDNENIKYWQIENEPYLSSFGICPKLNENLLKREVELVKSLDSRPIIISASGELSTWKKEKELSDILGITMYRVVHNSFFGFLRYPFGFNYYIYKSRLFGINPQNVIVVELQAEPWVAKGEMSQMNQGEIDKSLSLEQFKGNLQTAINTNFKQVYLWGAEWWYLQKIQGNDKYWDLAKEIFKNKK